MYVCWYVSVIFAHIYTCMLVNIHLWYTYYICTVYLLDTGMTFLSTIFVCLYLYILHSIGGFDSHMYISLYIFTAHLLYNHCILLRCSYYIVFTYVDFIVSYYFFLYLIMNWALSVFIALSSFPVDYCIKLLVFLYVCWYVSVMFAHIYTCMLVNIHFWYTYYICTVYLLDTGMTFLSTIFVFVVYHQYSLLST